MVVVIANAWLVCMDVFKEARSVFLLRFFGEKVQYEVVTVAQHQGCQMALIIRSSWNLLLKKAARV